MKTPNDVINIVRKILIKNISNRIIKQYHQTYEFNNLLSLRGGFSIVKRINRGHKFYFYPSLLIYKLGTKKVTGKLPKNY